jgi:Fur family transcriptional regulator, ferric uptake regulator
MHIDTDQLIAALRADGLRITDARRAVCAIIAESHADHLDASAIYDRAVQLGIDLDRSTVYRTLDALERAGAIRHAHLGESAVYHLADEVHHQHLVCSSCGTTVAIPEADLDEFLTAIRERTGFTPDIEHFAMSGLCSACTQP